MRQRGPPLIVGTGARHGIIAESLGANRIEIEKTRACGSIPNSAASAFNMKRIA